MASGSEQFSIAADGTFALALTSSLTRVTENRRMVTSSPNGFDKAREAIMLTRLETWHTPQELNAAFEATPDVEQTFYLSVNNVNNAIPSSLPLSTSTVCIWRRFSRC
jgi:hypothetical protein